MLQNPDDKTKDTQYFSIINSTLGTVDWLFTYDRKNEETKKETRYWPQPITSYGNCSAVRIIVN